MQEEEQGVKINDLEELVDVLMGVLEVLHDGKYVPSDVTMEYVKEKAKEAGYEPPRGWDE